VEETEVHDKMDKTDMPQVTDKLNTILYRVHFILLEISIFIFLNLGGIFYNYDILSS